MARVNSPHVVRYEDVFLRQRDGEGFFLCIMMEFCDGGDLGQHVAEHGRVSERKLLEWSYQLLVGLERVHELRLVHRYIKAENVFLTKTNGDLKIGDFGLATKLARDEKSEEREGTWNYMAPEVVARQPYSHPCDVWSMGCLFWEVSAGPSSFRRPTPRD